MNLPPWAARTAAARPALSSTVLSSTVAAPIRVRGGTVPLERSRPSCGCLRCTRPAPDGGLPGPHCAGEVTSVHRATGSGGHRANVDGGGRSGNDGSTGAALQLGGERRGSRLWSCARWLEVRPGPRVWRSHRRYAGRAAPPVGGVGWPVILRHLGRGHGRSPDHRPHGGCSGPFVGGGEPHERQRDRQLYGVDIR